MHLTGPGLWGEPEDPAEARRVLRRAPELGIDLIDTADSYGPEVSERLIGEELSGRADIVVATKAGFVRPNANDYHPVCGDPEHLAPLPAVASRARLGVERIALWQLHHIDPARPHTEQFEAIASLIEDGVIRHAGLCNVTVAEIQQASRRIRPRAHGAEPLHPHRPDERSRARPLRSPRHRVHSLVSPRVRPVDARRSRSWRRSPGARGDADAGEDLAWLL